MSIRLLGFIYGLVAVSITIWLESRGMKLQGQIFAWTAVAFGGPVGTGLVTGELRRRWFWVGLATSSVIHLAVVWNLRSKLPAPNAFAPLLFGGVEGVGLAIVSAKIRNALGHKSDGQRA